MLRGLDGDAIAHARLLSELSRYLRAFFSRRMAGRAEDLEDLVQETLLVVHEKRHTYRREDLLTPWVFAIARYKASEHWLLKADSPPPDNPLTTIPAHILEAHGYRRTAA